MGKLIHFRAQRCQKYALYRKMLQMKVVQNSISYKKLSGRICLSPLEGGAMGPPKIAILKYYYVLCKCIGSMVGLLFGSRTVLSH